MQPLNVRGGLWYFYPYQSTPARLQCFQSSCKRFHILLIMKSEISIQMVCFHSSIKHLKFYLMKATSADVQGLNNTFDLFQPNLAIISLIIDYIFSQFYLQSDGVVNFCRSVHLFQVSFWIIYPIKYGLEYCNLPILWISSTKISLFLIHS